MENGTMDVQAQIEKKEDANDSFSIFRKPNHPMILKFDNVVCEIKLKKTKRWCQNDSNIAEEKLILKGVTGIVKPGEVLAVLGPSGSGKTTLLTALGGRFVKGKLTGNITYNNQPFSKGVKRKTGFVTQDDIMYPHLTVTETLAFTAFLRLPNSLTKQEKIKQAETVVTQLGLTRCKNSIIGGPFLRGISGGEKKRVSIGQEMLINPCLLFLDEPTSGLDSTTAQTIMSTLWKLAHGGRTVVMTIHQPSSRLFYMFDKILLLSEGSPLYFGVGSNAMNYFASVGYSPTIAMNPADFLLDVASGVELDGLQNPEASKEALVEAYKVNLAEELKMEMQKLGDSYQSTNISLENKNFGDWPTTWWQQFCVLSKRGLKERRYESFTSLKISQILILAFLSGLLWRKSNISHLQDQTGLLYSYAAFWGFFPLYQAIFTFPQERRMLEKERSSGMYKLSSYFISRLATDLPMELVLPTIFLTISYWMAGLKQTASSFIVTLLVLLFSVLVTSGLGLALGAIFMDQKAVTTLGSIVMLLFLLVGGYYTQNIPKTVSWIQYLSIGHHTYKLLISAQFKKKDMYPCKEDGKLCLAGDYDGGIEKTVLDGQIVSVLALTVMLVGYRLVAYIALLRISKAY